MKRRAFISTTAFALSSLGCANLEKEKSGNYAMTVNGPLFVSQMGKTLPHEHILVDFVGWKEATKRRYLENNAYNAVLPKLAEIKQLGCNTFIDCTPMYLGRDPILLKRLSDASRLNIITNTGIYAARNFQHVPNFVYNESALQIAERWVREFRYGIDHIRSIRPGFIKLGNNSGTLSEIEIKLMRAACITNRNTALPIAIHTGKGTIRDQIRIIQEGSVPLTSLIWTHCQNEGDIELFTEVAAKGVWLSLDGVNLRTANQYITWLQELKKRNLLNKVLLSQDSGWFDPGKPGGGVINSYAYLFSHFIPKMRDNGFSKNDIKQITETNPQTAFSLGMISM